MANPDRDLLIDFFYIVVPREPIARRAKTQYEFDGRKCEVYRRGSRDWRGQFLDDHAVEFGAETKRQLLADMRSEA